MFLIICLEIVGYDAFCAIFKVYFYIFNLMPILSFWVAQFLTWTPSFDYRFHVYNIGLLC